MFGEDSDHESRITNDNYEMYSLAEKDGENTDHGTKNNQTRQFRTTEASLLALLARRSLGY